MNPAQIWVFCELNTMSSIALQTLKWNDFALSRRTEFPLIPDNPSQAQKFKNPLKQVPSDFEQGGFGELSNQALSRTMHQQNSTYPSVFHAFLVLSCSCQDSITPLASECAHFNFVT